MKIKTILFGATGMVGEGVLHVCLNHPDVESVLVIGRKSCAVTHGKLREIIHDDFFDYSSLTEELKNYNACFFCLGISAVGKTEVVYRRITYDMTMQVARTLSGLNPEMTFCYVSGIGTDSTEKGRLMWARVKGKTENHLMKLPFKAAYMFRPGYIQPKGLKNAYTIYKLLGPLYPLWKILIPRYVCKLEELGLAMIRAASMGYPTQILESKDIAKLARAPVDI